MPYSYVVGMLMIIHIHNNSFHYYDYYYYFFTTTTTTITTTTTTTNTSILILTVIWQVNLAEPVPARSSSTGSGREPLEINDVGF